MTDFRGNELKVGDKVIFGQDDCGGFGTYAGNLIEGVVAEMNKPERKGQWVIIDYSDFAYKGHPEYYEAFGRKRTDRMTRPEKIFKLGE